MLIRAAEIAHSTGERSIADVRVRGARVAAIDRGLTPSPDETVVDAHGGALLPGLHDHHIHLLALAAARRSVRCGPRDQRDGHALARALSAAAARTGSDEWIRGVGYHETVAGPLDRTTLDRWLPDRPLRIQHATGAAWLLNSAALTALGLDGAAPPGEAPHGVERDARGRPTGRLFRMDAWLSAQLPREPPALGEVGELLARYGVCRVSDASVDNDLASAALLASAHRSGALPQSLHLLGSDALAACSEPQVSIGARKIVLDDAALPPLDQLRETIERAHAAERNVAIHCVTRAELTLALRCLEDAGRRPGDRIEHAAVAPPELASWMAQLEVTVVTQPNFIFERGDRYLQEVEAQDRPWLYRAAGLVSAGVRVAGGTDAPYGEPDPWAAMQAAVDRKSEAGEMLGELEALTPERALALFSGAANEPGAGGPDVAVGTTADLCLLDRPWSRVRGALEASAVRMASCAGRIAWLREVD